MQTNGNVIRNLMVPSSTHVWEMAKGWARTFSKREVILDAALALIAPDSVAFVLFSLHRAFGNYTLTGF